MEKLRNPTLEYLNPSDNNRLRHTEKVIAFFERFPKIIRVETSKMANPVYVIKYLAQKREPEKKLELRNRFIIGFLFWTGVRVNELLKIQKKDLDLISRTCNVLTLKQKKTVYRPIPLDHVPVTELKFWNNYLIKISGEKLVDVTDRQVERIVKKELGQEFTPHTLRHGLGLWLYEYTKDIRIVAQVLRHTNIANTLIYTRLSMDGIREKLRL